MLPIELLFYHSQAGFDPGTIVIGSGMCTGSMSTSNRGAVKRQLKYGVWHRKQAKSPVISTKIATFNPLSTGFPYQTAVSTVVQG